MTAYPYDLHIHSCASPCADDDMTPANIAGMASLQHLSVVALTDHNTVRNCPAFFHHAKRYGLIPIAGMELSTAEDIHLICLFPNLESAMEFGLLVEKHLPQIRNRTEIFGHQLVMDEEDRVREEIPNLLLNATDLDLSSGVSLALAHGGVCYPAHIDRESNGILAVLGSFPEEPFFPCFELNDRKNLSSVLEKHPLLKKKRFVVSSDAHHLWSISEPENTLAVPDEPYSSALVRENLIRILKGD
ncbi:MAG: PHP domain-containing protein [Clostridia bacterium]|nr:PHP domain-containing protein [Clostridia bacterium]